MKRADKRCKLPIVLKFPTLINCDHGRMLARMNPSTSFNLGIFVVNLKMCIQMDDKIN